VLIPSIDIMDGRAVQLIGGKEKAIDAGDPVQVAQQFRIAGEIAVIDLNAAMGRGWIEREHCPPDHPHRAVPGRRRYSNRRACAGLARRRSGKGDPWHGGNAGGARPTAA
jgi:hypothetical protein